MGFRTSLDISARCPLYMGVVRTANGSIAGIECEFLCSNFGFDVSMILRCQNFQEMLDLKELLCDDRYEACPYYEAFRRAHIANKKCDTDSRRTKP